MTLHAEEKMVTDSTRKSKYRRQHDQTNKKGGYFKDIISWNSKWYPKMKKDFGQCF